MKNKMRPGMQQRTRENEYIKTAKRGLKFSQPCEVYIKSTQRDAKQRRAAALLHYIGTIK